MGSSEAMYLWLTTFKALNDTAEAYGLRLQVRGRPLTDPPPVVYQVVRENGETSEFESYQEALIEFLESLKEAIQADYAKKGNRHG